MKSIMRSTCLALLLANSVSAEIYETTDSEGNKVFTDMPTKEAEVVELPEANIADSVEPRPRPEAETAAPATRPSTEQRQDDGVYIIGDDRNERLEQKIAREKRKEVLEGDRPHEVLEAEPRHESVEARERAAEGAPHRAAPPVRHHR